MQGKAKILTVYLDEADHWHGRPLYLVLLERLKSAGLSGATAFRAVAGFGVHRTMHSSGILDLSANLPVAVQAIDDPDRIARFLPQLDDLVPEGLVTICDADIVRYGKSRPSP